MSRRKFLEALVMAGAGAVVPPVDAKRICAALADAPHTLVESIATSPAALATAAVPLPNPNVDNLELQRSPIAGFQYHEGEALWPLLSIGAPLDLVREPDNVHDDRAVRVDWRGRKLGYVPRLDNAAVSQLLDRDQPLSAEIVALRESRNPWGRVEFVVVLRGVQFLA